MQGCNNFDVDNKGAQSTFPTIFIRASEFQVILSVSLYLCEVYRRGTNVF